MKLTGDMNIIVSEETITLKKAIKLYEETKEQYNYLRFNIVDDLRENEGHYFDEAVKKMEKLKELKSKIKDIENYPVLIKIKNL